MHCFHKAVIVQKKRNTIGGITLTTSVNQAQSVIAIIVSAMIITPDFQSDYSFIKS